MTLHGHRPATAPDDATDVQPRPLSPAPAVDAHPAAQPTPLEPLSPESSPPPAGAVRPTARFMRAHPAHWIALGFGAGLSPVAAGTVGTLWAWLVWHLLIADLSLIAQTTVIAVTLPLSWWASTVTARHLRTADPGAIVIDVGMHGSGQGGKLCGDVRFEELDGWVKAATPVPGGVGPMTIAMLLQNTCLLAEKRADELQGLERLHRPATGEVYAVAKGFSAQYLTSPQSYTINDLRPLPDDPTLWLKPVLNGTQAITKK